MLQPHPHFALSTTVTLNAFQGPSLGLRRSVEKGANRAAALLSQAPGCAARWMLKQVQHDEVFWGAAE